MARDQPDMVLYHGWSSSASRKTRFCLAEKGLVYESRPMDLLTFEHHQDWYKALNPSGIVPALLIDGVPLVESNLINEYLDAAFPEPPLRPADPLQLYQMRLWAKYIDDDCLPAVQKPNWMSKMHPMARQWSDAELEARLAAIPTEGRRRLWYRMARDPFTAEEMETAAQVLRGMLDRIEAMTADGGWIIGGAFSLADIAAAPYVKRVEEEEPEQLEAKRRPRTADWWARLRARPAYPAAHIGDYVAQSDADWKPDAAV